MSELTFSPEDIFGLTKRKNMQSITAVGNDGKVYCVSKTNQSDSVGYRVFLNRQFNRKQFLGKYSYRDIRSDTFDKNIFSAQEKEQLKVQLSFFCENCAKGGMFYGFNYRKK